VLVAADHPVTKYSVSTYPSSVTREVLEATVAGESLGAAAALSAGLAVIAVDAGTNGTAVPGAVDLRALGLRGDLVETDALSPGDVERLLEGGRRLGARMQDRLVALGEVGVGNTTVAAALSAALLGLGISEAVGLGAGGDSATLERKRWVVGAALSRASARPGGLGGPFDALAVLGGPEFVVLAGVVLGVAGRGGAIVLDGLATSVAALCAVRAEPGVAAHLVAGQRSREKAHFAVLEELGLEPLLDLRMRAGEGVGAVLSTQMLSSGLRLRALTGKVSP
jgi:nicotinate-nucleotide--dimethylbenzimidazole phosphoribosyltransferase